jgi:hypothetical protein
MSRPSIPRMRICPHARSVGSVLRAYKATAAQLHRPHILLVSVRQGDRGAMGWLLPRIGRLLYESAVHLGVDIE